MPRLLTKLRVDEVSVVDHAAGEGTKIVLMKRDNSRQRHTPSPVATGPDFGEIFGVRKDDSGAHHVSHLADLIAVGSDGAVSRAQALHFLLHTKEGAATVHRLRTHKKEEIVTRTEELRAIAKDYGVVRLAKVICDDGAHGITEHELTALITEHAKREHPALAPPPLSSKCSPATTPMVCCCAKPLLWPKASSFRQ
jgi:hypothetical protein